MYSMVMMMAVASSGDTASFGGRNGGCDGGGCSGRSGLFSKGDGGCSGRSGLFGKHRDNNSCDGGGCSGREGLFSRMKSRKGGGSCSGEVAPTCPTPCPAPVAVAPVAAPVAVAVACPTPCAAACPEPCEPCGKNKRGGLFRKKNRGGCNDDCNTVSTYAAPAYATAGCAMPGAPVAAPATAPKTMPKADEKKKES